MKPALLAVAVAWTLGTTASGAVAADIIGLWATPAENGRVEITRCGDALCGRLVEADNIRADPGLRDTENHDRALRSRPVKGLQILDGFSGGPGRWTGGKVYNPEDGGTYSGSLELVSPDVLKLKGCIIAPLCKTQVWTRVK